jgi:ureidoacrylate peracid hydrolase
VKGEKQQHDPYRGLRGAYGKPGRDAIALLVVDMQNTFCHPAGAFARLGADVSPLAAVVPAVAALVAAARAAAVPVIFVKHVLRGDYRDGGILFTELKRPVRDAGAIVGGSWEAELVDELRPEPDDFIVEKRRFSAFYGTDLEVVLSSLRTEALVICGVTTNICVESTARDAAQRNYRTFVVADATAEVDPEKHEHALATLGYAFCRVVTSADVAAEWAA